MGIRILVVEDDERISNFLVRGLREEGFTVELAPDGDRASQLLSLGNWDLVILDWWLPGQDGLTVLQRFRQTDRSTPVLFLTARDAVNDRIRGLNSGADDYLGKPFAFEELLARTHALIRRRDSSDGIVLTYRDVKVDLTSQRAERAGTSLSLTAKEHALLIFFLRHPEQVLSRTRIYEHVWEEWPDGVSNTLEVHGPRLIQTLRGIGYLMGDGPEAGQGERP